MSELILYQTDDGHAEVRLRAEAGSVWLTQVEIADLFATTKQNVSLHAKNIIKEGELDEDSVVKESLTTAADEKNYRYKAITLDQVEKDYLKTISSLEKQAKKESRKKGDKP
jgi:hypothetical protein